MKAKSNVDREKRKAKATIAITSVADLPTDIQLKLLSIRDSLAQDDLSEAYHILYSIVDPEFTSHEPWKVLEEAYLHSIIEGQE